MENIAKLFGLGPSAAERRAQQSAQAQAQAAHVEAQEARRRRAQAEGETAGAMNVRSASMFLANRGTRYSGLKQSLGG